MFYDKHECVSSMKSLHLPGLNALYHSDYVPLTDLIGIYFQIRDDYMNLQSNQVSSLPLK
jgi:hypothetical protein